MTVTRLSGGVTPADGSDPRTFPTIWNATADIIDTAVVNTSVSGNVAIVGCERTAAMSVGDKMSFGNGAADHEISLPFASKLLSLSFSPGPLHTGDTTVQIVKNGVAQGTAYQVAPSGTAVASLVFGTPLAVAADDTFGVECTAESSPGDGGAASIVLRFD